MRPIFAYRLPQGAKLGAPVWSPDGKQFAFTDTTHSAIELWIGTTATGQTRRIADLRLNGVMGQPMAWLADNRTLFVRLVPEHRGQPPAQPIVPSGPHVQESSGRSGPVVTFEDMLSTPHDEDLFDYYATAQLAYVDAASGNITPVGKPGIFEAAEPSPDGQYLLVSQVHRPYSYLHPVSRFPQAVDVWDRAGQKLYQLADLPLADRIPVQGVRTGPRAYQWRADEPAALVWVEAIGRRQSQGESAAPRPHPVAGGALPVRAARSFRNRRAVRGVGRAGAQRQGSGLPTTTATSAGRAPSRSGWNAHDAEGRVIFSRNVQDRYHDPGRSRDAAFAEWPRGDPAKRRQHLSHGRRRQAPPATIRFWIAITWPRRNPSACFSPATAATKPWSAVLDDDGKRLLTRRESPAEPPELLHPGGRIAHAAD